MNLLFLTRLNQPQISVFVVFPGAPARIAVLPMRRRRLAFFPLIRWLPQERLRLILPLAVTFTRFDKPLWVFCFGIELIP